MKTSRLTIALLVLLALASLGTTALIALNIARQRSEAAADNSAINPGVAQTSGNPLFDHPLALPPFTLTERNGEPFDSASLRGKVWVADFFFTHCPGFCPRLTSEMVRLQTQFRADQRWEDLRLVSISVDPTRDTPERLRDYANSYEADPQHWLFLTGDESTVRRLVREGFKQPVDNGTDADGSPIIHTSNFVLVDRQGRIRGYYDAFIDEEMRQFQTDLERVLAEPAPQ